MVMVLLTAPIEGAHLLRLLLSSSTQSGRYPDKRMTGLPFTARVGKELELSLLKGGSRTVLHCAH